MSRYLDIVDSIVARKIFAYGMKYVRFDHVKSPEIYNSLVDLMKNNNGLYKGEEQKNFYLKIISTGDDKQFEFLKKNYQPQPPNNAIGCICLEIDDPKKYYETYLQNNPQRMGHLVWLDNDGIIKVDGIRNIGESERYVDWTAEIQEGKWRRAEEIKEHLSLDKDQWFNENAPDIGLVDRNLLDEEKKECIDDLQIGIKPQENIWKNVVEDAKEIEKIKPDMPVKKDIVEKLVEEECEKLDEEDSILIVEDDCELGDELAVIVRSVKDTEENICDRQGLLKKYYVTFIGEIEGREEKAYISVLDIDLQKFIGSNMDEEFIKYFGANDNSEKSVNAVLFEKAINRTIVFAGNFKSNGQFIFGKGVEIVEIV